MKEIGGKDEARLYLYDYLTSDSKNKLVKINKTDMPNMDELILRHRARYFLPLLFCRPKMTVLDFPCGSGYASEMFRSVDVTYEGMDIDEPTIKYCCHYYGGYLKKFTVNDLQNPHLLSNR